MRIGVRVYGAPLLIKENDEIANLVPSERSAGTNNHSVRPRSYVMLELPVWTDRKQGVAAGSWGDRCGNRVGVLILGLG